jgi:hypothetical protein
MQRFGLCRSVSRCAHVLLSFLLPYKKQAALPPVSRAASRLCRLHTICMLVRLLLCTGQSNISGDHMPCGGFSPCPSSMPGIPAPCQRRAAAGRLVCRPPGWPSSCMAAPLGSQQSRCSPRQLQLLGCMLPGRTVLSGLLPTGTCLGPVAEQYWPD